MIDNLQTLVEGWGIPGLSPAIWASLIALALLVVVAWIADRITQRILISTIVRIARRSRATWDDHFVDEKVFHQAAHLAPTLIIYSALPTVLQSWPGDLVRRLQTLALVYLTLVIVLIIHKSLNATLAIYNSTDVSRDVPLRPIIQLVQGIVAFAAVILLVGVFINRSASAILGGLGAFTAVLLLVFQQPILGLAAGIQLSANKMIRRGDWISVPRYNADGTVLDIALTTVSIQNWDKTISTIPANALITDTFRNWRGMEESGGRRIKRSILIDLQSIRFVDDELLDRMRRLQFLRDYLDARQAEIDAYNREHDIDPSTPGNGRRMTNIGSFRAYLVHYLRAHPKVSDEMTFLVRQLDATAQGVPIEIYVFLTEQRWAEFEAIQADIFDHIFAVVPEFGLRIYQQPSGQDFRTLAARG